MGLLSGIATTTLPTRLTILASIAANRGAIAAFSRRVDACEKRLSVAAFGGASVEMLALGLRGCVVNLI